MKNKTILIMNNIAKSKNGEIFFFKAIYFFIFFRNPILAIYI